MNFSSSMIETEIEKDLGNDGYSERALKKRDFEQFADRTNYNGLHNANMSVIKKIHLINNKESVFDVSFNRKSNPETLSVNDTDSIIDETFSSSEGEYDEMSVSSEDGSIVVEDLEQKEKPIKKEEASEIEEENYNVDTDIEDEKINFVTKKENSLKPLLESKTEEQTRKALKVLLQQEREEIKLEKKEMRRLKKNDTEREKYRSKVYTEEEKKEKREYKKNYYLLNKDKCLLANRKHYVLNKEKNKLANRLASKKHYSLNKDKCRLVNRLASRKNYHKAKLKRVFQKKCIEQKKFQGDQGDRIRTEEEQIQRTEEHWKLLSRKFREAKEELVEKGGSMCKWEQQRLLRDREESERKKLRELTRTRKKEEKQRDKEEMKNLWRLYGGKSEEYNCYLLNKENNKVNPLTEKERKLIEHERDQIEYQNEKERTRVDTLRNQIENLKYELE